VLPGSAGTMPTISSLHLNPVKNRHMLNVTSNDSIPPIH